MSAPPTADPGCDCKDRQDGDGDLSQSLKRLTIATSPPGKAPRSAARAAGPNPPQTRTTADTPPAPRPASAMRNPVRSSSTSVVPPPRAATPTLLRKASMNSLQSTAGATPSRRASAANMLPGSRPRSGRSPLRSLSPELPEPPVPTPYTVAHSHFKAELETHHGPEHTRRAETVVILQDACYGHRYSRPRASRAQLSTIVERPERIKACVLGVSAAYVRLGERHQDGAFPVHPDADVAALPSVPFRIERSDRRLSLTSPAVTNVHGAKWMEELTIMCDTAEMKLAGGGKELQRPDVDRGANAEAPKKLHEGDLYLCAESLEAMEGALGGVCDAVDAVFRPQGPQRAFVAIRPPGHHCSASHPSGFCWVNNVHVGIMHAVLSHGLTHAAIIDFDLHHGDGSQAIAWQHNARGAGLAKNAAWWKKTSIGYFSLHDINSYPCETGDEDKVRNASICIDGAHGQSVWNVHLQPWRTDAEFWALYESKYAVLLEKTRAYLKSHTARLRASGLNSRAAIFLSAGFDASEYEDPGMQRHSVNVPTDFYARFTRDVVRIAAEEGTSVEGRIVSVLEGGYSDRALCSGVFSHLCGLAGDGPSRDQESGSGAETGQKANPQRARKDSSASERGARRYEPSWWSATELDELEATLTRPVPAPRPVRYSPPPTYSSPTQASQARAVNLKTRRSMSGLSHAAGASTPRVFFEPPPPPVVPWTVATMELSKLLVPAGRQTNSCTAEELNAEATRARRERQAALAGRLAAGIPEERPPTRMSLRERKPKPKPAYDELDGRSRRKTVAGPAVAADEPARGPGKHPRASRRLSVASTVVSAASADSSDATTQSVPARGTPAEPGNRPASSMGVAGPGGGLNVKKTRAPKKEPARAAKAKKTAAANGPPLQPAPAATPSTDETGEVDKLAGAMKKIKITVITKAQKEARERERLERERLSKTPQAENQSPPPSNTASSPAGPANAQHLPSPTPSPAPHPPLQSPTNPLTPSQETLATPPAPGHAAPLVSPPATDPRPPAPGVRSPAEKPASPASTPLGTTVDADSFIHYQPDGAAAMSVQQEKQDLNDKQQLPNQKEKQQLQWLPPNVCATPVQSPTKREDLPVFSSTGVIPFAPGPGGAGSAAGGSRLGDGLAGGDGVGSRSGDDGAGTRAGGDGGESRREVPESPHF